jgi:hypothetical protein
MTFQFNFSRLIAAGLLLWRATVKRPSSSGNAQTDKSTESKRHIVNASEQSEQYFLGLLNSFRLHFP